MPPPSCSPRAMITTILSIVSRRASGYPLLLPIPRFVSRSYRSGSMAAVEEETARLSLVRNRGAAATKMCMVSSFSTELLEMRSEDPKFLVLFIPGNPGIVSFYKDFVEVLYELLDGKASVTAIGHIAHTEKDWERGSLFSLQDQINHKVNFIRQEMQSDEPPIILIGHSIGAYMGLEVFKRLPQVVKFNIGLYPFLTVNRDSLKQSMIKLASRSAILSTAISSFMSLVGSFPTRISSALVRQYQGGSWSSAAVGAACSHLLKYHTMRNVLFLARTEFAKLSGELDWTFMKENQNRIAFLYGVDDHWGPLSFSEEVSRQAPDLALSIEREGHTHTFCCSEAGSSWVARHVATLIKNQTLY